MPPSLPRPLVMWALLILLAACGEQGNATPAAVTTQATAAPVVRTRASTTPTAGTASAGPSALPGATNTPSRAAAGADWPTYHRDNLRTGYIPDLPDPDKLAVAWSTALDGAVYAEPLAVRGRVIVGTEYNSLYSLDTQTGKVQWQTNIGAPVSRSSLPCGNIDPLGITGTPVYDPAGGLVFAVAEVSGPSHLLVGVDLNTGQVKLHRTINPQGMEPAAQQERAALALANGMVYVAFGGLFGDCGNYHGWVLASKTDGTGPLLSYQVPTGREGGIWAPPGPVVDSSGRLFVSVGNGSEVLGKWDHSDAVLRLSSQLQLEDAFAPSSWRQENAADLDLGSLGPVLLPGDLVFIAGKAGIGYLLHADALGGVGGQAAQLGICGAYGGSALAGSTIYVPCNEGVQQVLVGPGASLKLGWRADGVPGSPVIGGNTVYSLDRGGTLHALDIANGKDRATVNVGQTTRFATPTLYGRLIFVGTTSAIVAVTF